jgi:hypothetical protein
MKVKQILSIKEIADDKKLPCDMYELYDTKYMSVSRDEMIPIAEMDIVHLIRAFKNDRHRLNNQLTDKDLIRQNEDLVNANRQLAKQHDIWKEKAMNMVEKSSYQVMWDNCQELQKKLDQEVRIDTQEGKVVELEMENQRLVQQLEHDERNVYINEELEDTLKDTIKSNNELIQLNKQLKASLRQVNLTPTVSTESYDIAWKQVDYWRKIAEDNFIHSVKDSEDKDTWQKKYEHEAKMAESWKSNYYKKDVIKGCGYTFSEIPNDTDGQEFVDTMKKYFNKKSYNMRVRGQHIKPELRGTGATAFGQNISESSHLRVYIEIK